MTETQTSLPTMVVPSPQSTLAFLAIVLSVVVFVGAAFWRAWRDSPRPARVTCLAVGALLTWMGICAGLASGGVLAGLAGSPQLMAYIVACNGLALVLALSRVGSMLVLHVPIAWLLGFQAFRLPLELVLHSWYEQGTLPVQMTYAGANFDIVSGVAALAFWTWERFGTPNRQLRWILALTTNVIGSALLLNVMSVAVRSTPWPLRTYLNDPPVLLVFHTPYTWVLPVCVSGALWGHVLVFRWLLAERRALTSGAVTTHA